MYDPNEQAEAKDCAGSVEQEKHEPDPGTKPNGSSRPGWRERAVRAARFTVQETLRGISSGLGGVAVTTVILWWQSRH
ncbi:hypothetical protein ACFTUC_39065 [Streptomyces sp. NPDC056944]|uniref:hypothetical protein n=1 Tax=unclassified Streptomyces TaxID=2593676 RepID=UPI003624F25C